MPRLPSMQKFRGDFTLSFEQWIRMFEAQLDAIGAEEDRFKNILLCCCDEAAYSCLTAFLAENAGGTYDEMKGILSDKFCGDGYKRTLQTKLRNMKYSQGMKVTAFITELCRVIKELYALDDNKAIRKLLHVAVSDVNDDVRRAAVQSLGFLLFRTPEQVPSVVSLLSENYNPHVRCGADMALGTACAGTRLKEAIGLIEPLMNDPVNYVRQYALIASALITIQQTEVTCPKVKTIRETYTKVIADKHEDSIAKFGAILAQGIIDAGSRNCTLSSMT